ncbi:MAG: hypothetical protein ACR2P2_12140 [Nakamurella sp.]
MLRGVFGYSRDASSASSRLVMFRGKQGAFRVYADTNETEALLIRLDPLSVARWLYGKGLLNAVPTSAKEARTVILQHALIPGRGDEVSKLPANSRRERAFTAMLNTVNAPPKAARPIRPPSPPGPTGATRTPPIPRPGEQPRPNAETGGSRSTAGFKINFHPSRWIEAQPVGFFLR